jgi:hypothetical protein
LQSRDEFLAFGLAHQASSADWSLSTPLLSFSGCVVGTSALADFCSSFGEARCDALGQLLPAGDRALLERLQQLGSLHGLRRRTRNRQLQGLADTAAFNFGKLFPLRRGLQLFKLKGHNLASKLLLGFL